MIWAGESGKITKVVPSEQLSGCMCSFVIVKRGCKTAGEANMQNFDWTKIEIAIKKAIKVVSSWMKRVWNLL